MYKVTYRNHDQGAADGFMIRESMNAAEQTARLMQECGYMVTVIEVCDA